MPPEVDRNEQTLAAVRAAAQPLAALGRSVPPLDDSSVQATAVCLAHLRWLVASAGRALIVRQAALSQADRADLAMAVLDAEYPDLDLDADQLPEGVLPPRVRGLRLAGVDEQRALVDRIARPLVEIYRGERGLGEAAAAMDHAVGSLGLPRGPEDAA